MVFEVMMTQSGYQVGKSTCKGWVYSNSLSHTVLRDKPGSSGAQGALGLQTYDVIVIDQQMKILHKGSAYSSTGKSKLLSVLSQL